MKKASAGFTLIELVIVIVILGILAATALPRFLDVSDGAHRTSFITSEGALRSGVNLARAKWYADGQSSDPQEVDIAGGLPVNNQGWLTAADGDACQDIWNALIEGGENFDAAKSGDKCEFTYTPKGWKVIYNPTDGTVSRSPDTI